MPQPLRNSVYCSRPQCFSLWSFRRPLCKWRMHSGKWTAAAAATCSGLVSLSTLLCAERCEKSLPMNCFDMFLRNGRMRTSPDVMPSKHVLATVSACDKFWRNL